MESAKKYLLGMTLGELKEVAKSLGMPAFTGGQIAKWLYTQHVKSIDEMTNISKANREKLAAEYAIGCKEPIDAQHSKDGTIKYLFPTDSGKFVETVYIPDEDRATLCVSSQVGCKMNCLFCRHQLCGLVVQRGVHTDCNVTVALFEESFQFPFDADTAHRDTFWRPAVTEVGCHNFCGTQYIVKIIHRFTLPHEDNIRQFVTFRE